MLVVLSLTSSFMPEKKCHCSFLNLFQYVTQGTLEIQQLVNVSPAPGAPTVGTMTVQNAPHAQTDRSPAPKEAPADSDVTHVRTFYQLFKMKSFYFVKSVARQRFKLYLRNMFKLSKKWLFLYIYAISQI